MKKQWWGILIGLTILFCLQSCKKKTLISVDSIIAQHTSGLISKKSVIKIGFQQEQAIPAGQKADSSAFKFNPAVKGKAEWQNSREVVFIPEHDLISGKIYQVEVDLDQLLKTKSKYGRFRFIFQVIPQDFELTVRGFEPDQEDPKNRQRFSGEILTADWAEPELVAKMLRVEHNGQPKEIRWTKYYDNRLFRFEIGQIERLEEDSKLKLIYNGQPLGVDRRGERTFTVLSKNDFALLEIRPEYQPQKYIELRFSDLIDPKQDLRGLIRVRDYPVSLEITQNVIKVFSSREFLGEVAVRVEKGIRSESGKKMPQIREEVIRFESLKPDVRFATEAVIIPYNERIIIPIEAVNLKSIQVTALEVYQNNIGQYLQVNPLGKSNEIRRVGRYLWRKTIELSTDPAITSRWSRYQLDVTELFQKHPGSLIQLTLSFNRSNSTYPCEGPITEIKKEPEPKNLETFSENESSYWDYAEEYYETEYRWADRDNPCTNSYYHPAYNRARIYKERVFLASNIGLLAKKGQDKQLTVLATDLLSGEPLNSCRIQVFNFQNQLLAEGETDSSGLLNLQIEATPFYLLAKSGRQQGFLKLNPESALETSHFDVGGEVIDKGVKGFIFGERGVWRPGDDIYLTFVLHSRLKDFPLNQPALLELYDPQGKLYKKYKPVSSLEGFFCFRAKTSEESLTGNWKARIIFGGLSFEKTIKVETIVPNRLKVNLEFPQQVLYADQPSIPVKLFSQWLHGGKAANLKAEVYLTLRSKQTNFTRFADYYFDDPCKSFSSEQEQIFEGNLDSEGKTAFNVNLSPQKSAPGMLSANFESRVYEPGGGYSSERFSIDYYPYKSFVGIKPPRGDQARNMLLTDTNHVVKIATVDARGNPVSRKNIRLYLYKVNWKWWWEKGDDSLLQYASDFSQDVILSGEISTLDGNGEWSFEVKYPSWGRYMLRAYDPESGHSSAAIIYIDWPGWAGRSRQEQPGGATRFNFTTDKQSYRVGEEVTLFLNDVDQGRVLVSLENSTRVLKIYWADLKATSGKLKIPVTAEMYPNFYINLTYLQPAKDRRSDAPLRMYGIVNVRVEDSSTVLQPQLITPEEFKPNSETEVKVSEKNGREMNYVLMIVDEGLLGLTRFQVPDLHQEFYRREALGVTTWDLYDKVYGMLGADLERLLSIGGDEKALDREKESKRRFPPLVIFQGPFKLKKGEQQSHRFKIGNYLGAVRVMVVAGDGKAYGSVQKEVPVRQDLMLLVTLPRQVRVDEEFEVPLTIFNLSAKIRNVDLRIKTSNEFKVVGKDRDEVEFSAPGEIISSFRLQAKSFIHKGWIEVQASAGKIESVQKVYLDVLATNPPQVRVDKLELIGGEESEKLLRPFGISGTNSCQVEVSAIGNLELDKKITWLISYPYGCLEQTTSIAFAQLYLPLLYALSENEANAVEKNIKEAIEKLKLFQNSNGGFNYWPGWQERSDSWATSYAGFFLLEAQKRGYYVSNDFLERWVRYQRQQANSWVSGDPRMQAFCLYTLSRAKKPDIGAMNRLKEEKLDDLSALLLAACFDQIKQPEAVRELLAGRSFRPRQYREHAESFGSTSRDLAMFVYLLSELGQEKKAASLEKELEAELASAKWLSTQETAFALMALASFYKTTEKFSLSFSEDGANWQKLESDKPFIRFEVKNARSDRNVSLGLKNFSQRKLFLTILQEGIPPGGEEKDAANGLELEVRYLDSKNNRVDLNEIKQGTNLIIEVKVINNTNRKIENIVLHHLLPSGWQIHNARLSSGEEQSPTFDYQDIRDDRVDTFFALDSYQEKVFRIMVNASFCGKFYRPAIYAEAMYDRKLNAQKAGGWVVIKK